MRTWASMAVVAGCLSLGTAASASDEVKIDQRIPLKFEGDEVLAPVSIEAGPVKFTEVRVRNVPGADEIKKAGDHSRPKPVVAVDNEKGPDAKVRVEVKLEDEEGKSYLSCTRSSSIDSGAHEDHINACWLDAMLSSDWPKVKVFHLIATVTSKK
jgi:hypothetical protein